MGNLDCLKRRTILCCCCCCCIVILGCVSAFVEGDARADVVALMALKRSIIHDPFNVTGDWDPRSAHACNWTAIKCSSNPTYRWRVVELQLWNSSLQGFIPAEIGNLSMLQILDLSYNNLTGHIPSSIGGLSKLRALHLSMNSDLGGIIPQQLGLLGALQELDLYSNNHTGTIPRSLSNRSHLRILDLSENSLSGPIPSGIGRLKGLSFLNLYQNDLTGAIAPSLLNCTNMRSMAFTYNSLSGTIPSELGSRLTNLEKLLLFGNGFIGTIPESIGNCTRMVRLELGMNSLQGNIPMSLGKLRRLEILNLAHAGSFVSDPHKAISIFGAFFRCPKLLQLDISGNSLAGNLPANIGLLPKSLQVLNVEHNAITGRIPESIGNLSSLTTLYMAGNELQGVIPPAIAGMRNIQALDMSGNRLQGRIPLEISGLNFSLAYLYLGSNRLSGLVPGTIGGLQNLRELNFSMNSFTGSIPSEISECQQLESLDLSKNNFTGSIPSGVASLRNIQAVFDLSSNSLTGTVPPEIQGLEMAQVIDLSCNNLSGFILMRITGWINVEYLNFSFNNFEGTLPPSVGEKLTGVQYIDLSHNNFTGPIPESLTKLPNLVGLNFSYNDFQGRVPCTGAFKNLDKSSFLQNPELCGSCMKFSECRTGSSHDSGHRHSSRRTKIILFSCIPGGILILLFAGLWGVLFKRPRQEGRSRSSQAHIYQQFMMLSRKDLERATDNFNPGNLLGSGGYGEVYKGVLQSGEVVAVKRFSVTTEQSAEKEFMRECQTLGMVRHRNLVKIITACSSMDFKALVMQLMPNGSLDELIHRRDQDGRLPAFGMLARVGIVREVASGLSYLHHDCTPAIVHCDVKPQNVLLDSDNTARLSDFGLARFLGDSAVVTASTLVGSVGYIAPEFGYGGGISVKGDVYSFGVLVLEVLTRTRPTDPMFGEGMTLSKWISEAFEDQSRVMAVVRRVNEAVAEEDEVEVERFLAAIDGLATVGLLCTFQLPEKRPTMRDVEAMLANLRHDMLLQN